MFKYTTPEKAGVSSEKILDFLKTLDKYHLVTHSIIMARGNEIFTECYYEPFDEHFMHRLYSVSKSFVAVAIGLAYTEGLISLDDIMIDFFPEYKNTVRDELFAKTTIRDMLTMRSNVTDFVDWWGKFDDRTESYYTNKSKQLPGTMFYYDSVGSAVLGCIIEKLTGKNFLEYLKEKILLNLGFSKSSYVLYAPGGGALGDSGVICTTRDLLIFARFVMNLGEAEGKQYIDREFMKQAVSKQTDNDIDGGFAFYKKYGYGYLIWKARDNGFMFLGMGDQIAVCDVKHDFIFVMTADNQADSVTSRAIIFHELYRCIIDNLNNDSIEENEEANKRLKRYISDLKLVYVKGFRKSSFAEKVNGVSYVLNDNPMKIKEFTLYFFDKNGELEFYREGKSMVVKFGLLENVIGEFPEDMRNSNVAGELCQGRYKCAASAAWVEEDKLAVKAQIIDTYFGCLNIYFSFSDDSVTVLMKKSGQYLLDGYEGYAIGKMK